MLNLCRVANLLYAMMPLGGNNSCSRRVVQDPKYTSPLREGLAYFSLKLRVELGVGAKSDPEFAVYFRPGTEADMKCYFF